MCVRMCVNNCQITFFKRSRTHMFPQFNNFCQTLTSLFKINHLFERSEVVSSIVHSNSLIYSQKNGSDGWYMIIIYRFSYTFKWFHVFQSNMNNYI